MGMGEPLLNLDAVLPAISLLTSPETLGLSPRRLTVSTSGYLPQFDQLTQSGFRGRLAISLHAPNQELRASLMPVAKVYPLDKLMEKMDQYTKLTNKRISYEYILIAGVTDNVKQAGELVKLFGHRLAHLNLIPYNPIPGTDWQRPSRNRVMKFAQILRSAGIPCSVRVTFSDDINAACGQLAKNYSANPNHN
jgi:23S rRNA (adenine2503-C2)-methyltransferase